MDGIDAMIVNLESGAQGNERVIDVEIERVVIASDQTNIYPALSGDSLLWTQLLLNI